MQPAALLMAALSMASMLEAVVIKTQLTSAEVNEVELKAKFVGSTTTTTTDAATTATTATTEAATTTTSTATTTTTDTFVPGITKGDHIQELKSHKMMGVVYDEATVEGKHRIYVHFDSGAAVWQAANDFEEISKGTHLANAKAVYHQKVKHEKDMEFAFKKKVNYTLKISDAETRLKVYNDTGNTSGVAEVQAELDGFKAKQAFWAANETANREQCKGLGCVPYCVVNSHPWKTKCLWEKCNACHKHCGATSGANVPQASTCSAFCKSSKQNWSDRCMWKHCKGCTECASLTHVPLSTHCAGHCMRSTTPWEDKCLWSNKCNSCAQCSAYRAHPHRYA